MVCGLELRTLGHATLLLSSDGVPLLATDPWLVGSTYCQSWWLDRYPADDDVDLIAATRNIYVTHSHQDHFHLPTLRRLANPATLHPDLPNYSVPRVLKSMGMAANTLTPGRWYELTPQIHIVSLPVLADDSVLIVDTPNASVVNLNDCVPPSSYLRMVRKRYLVDGKPVLVLRSHSPASSGASMYRDGVHLPLHDARDYARISGDMASALHATHFISFASQAFFGRSDSMWANEARVFWDDLATQWRHPDIELCRPHVTMNLETLAYSSTYQRRPFELDPAQAREVQERETAEGSFELPEDFSRRLQQYLSEVWFLRLVFRRGIGWSLRTSKREFFYDVRTRKLTEGIPDRVDAVVTIADQMLYEAVVNGNVTDVGITMTIRTDSYVDIRRPYLFFSLAGLRDAGHFQSWSSFLRFGWFYARMVSPNLFWWWWHNRASAPALSLSHARTSDSPASATTGTRSPPRSHSSRRSKSRSEDDLDDTRSHVRRAGLLRRKHGDLRSHTTLDNR